jgi:hypothetical protein
MKRLFPPSLALALFFAVAADAEVLLRDDFDGSGLDATKWSVPTGPGSFFGRTQIRPPSVPLTVAGGVIRLQLDTYNPSALVPGDSFFGSEIDTLETFAVEGGLDFEARVRLVSPLPAGLVGALFSFVYLPASGARDEIDFELLSNDLVAARERVLTNVFENDDFSQPGDKAFADVAGLDLDAFHVYRVRWLAGRVQWFVDGALVREEHDSVPDDPMNVRLNLWAPDSFFVEAYDASLQPVATPEENEVFFYEVDWVEIRRPESLPGLAWGVDGAALPVLALIGTAAFALRIVEAGRSPSGTKPGSPFAAKRGPEAGVLPCAMLGRFRPAP